MLEAPIPPTRLANLPQCDPLEYIEIDRYQTIERINPALHSFTWEQQTDVIASLQQIENERGLKHSEAFKMGRGRERCATRAEKKLARYGLDLNGQFFEVNQV